MGSRPGKPNNPNCRANLRPGKLGNPNAYLNLKPVHTTEEARALAMKSVEKRRAKKAMQQAVKDILKMSLHSGTMLETEDVESIAELKGQNISVQDAIAIAQVQKALKGDTTSAQFVMQVAGEKPADKVEVGMSIEDYVKTKKVKL